MLEQTFDIEAVFVVDGAVGFDDGDDFDALFGHKAGGHAADVAEALDDDAGFGGRDLKLLESFLGDEQAAAAGGLGAAAGAAEVEGLAGDDGGGGFAAVHGVGVHYPGHGAFVGVHVGRRDVFLRSDDVDDGRGVAAGDTFEFDLGHDGGVTDDAAFAAAVGEIDDCALPGHPGGEGADLVEGNVGRVADAAFGGAAGDGVLDAVAGEDLDLAIVKHDGDGDGELFGGGLEDLAKTGVEREALSGIVETDLGVTPRVELVGGVVGEHRTSVGHAEGFRFSLSHWSCGLPTEKPRVW